MNIQEFNNKVKALGKEYFGDKYKFGSTGVDSIMYGHHEGIETTYRCTIFNNGSPIKAESPNIDMMFELLEMEFKKLNVEQSSIEL